jgi:hypothetical protein
MAEATETKTITRTEYLTLVGLFALLPRHKEAIQDIERAAAHIVGEAVDEGGYAGRVSDMTWDTNASADALLRQMHVEVVPDGKDLTDGG